MRCDAERRVHRARGRRGVDATPSRINVDAADDGGYDDEGYGPEDDGGGYHDQARQKILRSIFTHWG